MYLPLHGHCCMKPPPSSHWSASPCCGNVSPLSYAAAPDNQNLPDVCESSSCFCHLATSDRCTTCSCSQAPRQVLHPHAARGTTPFVQNLQPASLVQHIITRLALSYPGWRCLDRTAYAAHLLTALVPQVNPSMAQRLESGTALKGTGSQRRSSSRMYTRYVNQVSSVCAGMDAAHSAHVQILVGVTP